MIKLMGLLGEIELPKNEWVPIPTSELKDYENEILNLIQNAYKPIGGNPNFKNKQDVTSQGADYEVINLDDDEDIEGVSVSKQRPGGEKSVALGHDGSKDAKSAIIKRKVQKLKQQGHYIEASGKMAEILIGKGVTVVTDPKVISKALKGKDIKMNDDGTYQRYLGGKLHTKMMLGKPNK